MELRMKESYGEGVAHHTGPESCVVDRKVKGEALTCGGGVRTGKPLSGEIYMSRTPTLLSEAGGHIEDAVCVSRSWVLRRRRPWARRGNSVHGNREIPQVPSQDRSPVR
jgi:RNA-directed DNA polymerase